MAASGHLEYAGCRYWAVGGRNPLPLTSLVTLVKVSDGTQEYDVAISSLIEPSMPKTAWPSQIAWAMDDDIHAEGGADAVIHFAHFAELLRDGINGVGKSTVTKDNNIPTLTVARDRDTATWE